MSEPRQCVSRGIGWEGGVGLGLMMECEGDPTLILLSRCPPSPQRMFPAMVTVSLKDSTGRNQTRRRRYCIPDALRGWILVGGMVWDGEVWRGKAPPYLSKIPPEGTKLDGAETRLGLGPFVCGGLWGNGSAWTCNGSV